MKRVDKHFDAKYDRRRNMTVKEIREEKQKKFLERSKQKLFNIVDNIDYIKAKASLKRSSAKDKDDASLLQ